MIPAAFDYARPSTLDEAVQILAQLEKPLEKLEPLLR